MKQFQLAECFDPIGYGYLCSQPLCLFSYRSSLNWCQVSSHGVFRSPLDIQQSASTRAGVRVRVRERAWAGVRKSERECARVSGSAREWARVSGSENWPENDKNLNHCSWSSKWRMVYARRSSNGFFSITQWCLRSVYTKKKTTMQLAIDGRLKQSHAMLRTGAKFSGWSGVWSYMLDRKSVV